MMTDREVLEARALVLARSPAATAGSTVDVVTFGLAGETYAIESRAVQEVFRLTELARLPGAEPPVFGVTAWRGALLTILDLRPVLGLSATALNDLGRVIVLGINQPTFGILADQVHELITVPTSVIGGSPHGVAPRSSYVRGVTRDAVVVLAVEKLLALHT